ncbi:MAG TPA: hypothetical protein VLR89_09795 [Anaerolineaceae bacterium]|nr:hypothetical protein [Anaerolineaceae bacterium]
MLPGQACPARAGRYQKAVSTGEGEELNYRQILRSLMARNMEIDPLSLAARYTSAQRLQLAETAMHCLDGEIQGLRQASIAFKQLAQQGSSEEEMKAAGNALELYGRSCVRIGNLIKINVGLKGGDTDELASQLLRAVDIVTFPPIPEMENSDGSN